MNIEQNIQQKIKNITPFPKWEFKTKNILFSLGFILFVLVSSLSVSVIIFLILNSDIELYSNLNQRFLFLLKAFPYFWIILSILFLFFAYNDVMLSDKGYKYLNLKNVLLTISLIFLLGTFFYKLNISQIFESYLYFRVPVYSDFIYNRKKMWNNPENGVIAGRVKSYTINKLEQNIRLEDPNKKIWVVKFNGDTIFRKQFTFEPGLELKIIGKITDPSLNEFSANDVRPLCEKLFNIRGIHKNMK